MDLKNKNKFSKASIIMLAFYMFMCYAECIDQYIVVSITGWNERGIRDPAVGTARTGAL